MWHEFLKECSLSGLSCTKQDVDQGFLQIPNELGSDPACIHIVVYKTRQIISQYYRQEAQAAGGGALFAPGMTRISDLRFRKTNPNRLGARVSATQCQLFQVRARSWARNEVSASVSAGRSLVMISQTISLSMPKYSCTILLRSPTTRGHSMSPHRLRAASVGRPLGLSHASIQLSAVPQENPEGECMLARFLIRQHDLEG